MAASMVFLYHNRKYWRDDIPPVLLRMLNEFHTGVSVFFVLSGFLIAYTYQDKPFQSRGSYARYFLIRLARIFPIYVLILLAMYIDKGFPSAKESLLTLSLTHGFSDNHNLEGIPQAWSLTVELSFYAFAPVIYHLLKRNFLITLGFLSLLLFLSLAIGYGLHAIHCNKDSFFYPWFFVLNATFAGRCVEFLVGMALAHFVLRSRPGHSLRNYKFATLTGSIGSVLVIYLLSLFESDIYHEGTSSIAGLLIRNFLFPVSVVLLLYGLITERTWLQRLLSTKALVLLGGASYIFYLVHIGYVNGKWKEWHLFPDRNFILLWLTAIVAYLLIEKPVYQFLKKRILRRNI